MTYLIISIAIIVGCFILAVILNQLNPSKKVFMVLNPLLRSIPWLVAFAYIFIYTIEYIKVGAWDFVAFNLIILLGGMGCALVAYQHFTVKHKEKK